MQYALGHDPQNHVLQPIAFVEWREFDADIGDFGRRGVQRARHGVCFPRGAALSEALRGIREGPPTQFDFECRLGWVQTIAEGVCSLHSEGVTHRDLKPGNIILVTGTGPAGFDVAGAEPRRDEVYLTDFGCARVMESLGQAGAAASQVGTLQYMAPEVLWNEPRDDARVDVYALSIVSWEILSVEVPFGGVPDPTAREMVRKGVRPQIPSEWPRGVREAIGRGWNSSALQRGSAQQFFATMYGPVLSVVAKGGGR